jgi:hypothetical protein
MIEITPDYPKPMFVGTPVPLTSSKSPAPLPAESQAPNFKRRSPTTDLRTVDDGRTGGLAGDSGAYYEEKMKQIIFPQVQFEGATAEEAIEFLRIKSRDYDSSEKDPARRGMSLIIKPGPAPSTARISLDLKNVSYAEALRQITQLAGMKYAVEPHAIVVTPRAETSEDSGKYAAAKSGLLPVKLDVPATGRVFEFHGNQKPEPLLLRYQSWERQMAKACFWLVAGLLLFWCCGRKGTCWRTPLVILVLICLPLALLPSWLAVCNALLAGWLLGLIVWLLWRAGRWVEQQDMAAKTEVAS